MFVIRKIYFLSICLCLCIGAIPYAAWAKVDKIRIMWNADPATTAVIGWNQISGQQPMLVLDTQDNGTDASAYAGKKAPTHTNGAKGMANKFVSLTGLKPNTKYYFMVTDSDGGSGKRYFFQTAPDNPSERLSIIAGGDSRNHRDARINANKLVGKLRSLVVLFGGDMTGSDSAEEWQEWLDDWQYTISEDGRITPIVVTRGNHEYNNAILEELFLAPKDVYYALTFGGSLLRTYTLNSLIAPGGNQKAWLENDLENNANSVNWLFTQYHYPFRPHTSGKEEKLDQYDAWAPLFFKYGMDVAIECDAHLAKSTWPLRPDTGPESDEGFTRDDDRGTVFVGEGGWGAPLRRCDDDKTWTRNSGSFNQFNLIFVDEEKIEIRFVKTDGADQVRNVDPNNIFKLPIGISIWNPTNGAVITIPKVRKDDKPDWEDQTVPIFAVRSAEETLKVVDFAVRPRGKDIFINWEVTNEPCDLEYVVERSIDGSTFAPVGKQRARCLFSGTYEVIDANILDRANQGEKVKYRLVKKYGKGEVTSQEMMDDNSELDFWDKYPKLTANPTDGDVLVQIPIENPGKTYIVLISPRLMEIKRWPLGELQKGNYTEKINIKPLPKGNYLLVVRCNGSAIARYKVVKAT